MFRTLVALLALANVSAFSPIGKRAVSSSIRMSETPPAPPAKPAAAEPAAEPAEEAPPPPPPVKESSGGAQFSRSLPFLLKPQKTVGVLGGEAEFDPLGFSELYDIK